jgi:hypothetical protein
MSGAAGRCSRRAVALVFALQACAAAPLAFFRVFTGFRNYDDEGTFMLWDRHLAEGHALYDEVWSFYGPLPHLLRYLLHQAGALPLTHDAYRLLTLLNWLGAASLLSWGVLRFTRSLPLAALAHGLALVHLLPITTEPAHPQEYVALLLGAVVVLASRLGERGFAAAGLGAATAALLFTKMNAGALLGLALGASLVMGMPAGRATHALRALALAALALVAPALMGWDAASERWGGLALGAAMGGLLSCACALEGGRERARGLRELAGFAGSAALCALGLLAAVVVLLDSSPGAFAWSVFVLPSRITDWVGSARGVEPRSLLPVLAGTASWLAWRARSRGAEAGPRGRRRAAWARVLLGLAIAGLLLGLRGPGRYGALLLALPALWLLLLPTSAAHARLGHWLPRLALALAAVLEGLYVYPVTGSQRAIATLLIPVCGLVCLGDGARELAELGWAPRRRRELARAGAGLLATALAASYAAAGLRAARGYGDAMALALPGARLVRADEERAAVFGWLARNVAEHCDTFVAIPGFNSLYFWTGAPAPGPASADRWFLFFEPGQRRALVDRLLAHPRPCFLVNSRSTHFWLGKARDPGVLRPLSRRIQRDFQPVARASDWTFMVGRGRPAPLPTRSAWVAPSGAVWVLVVSLPPELERRAARLAVLRARRAAGPAADEARPGVAWGLELESVAPPPTQGEAARLRRSVPLAGWMLASLARPGTVVRVLDAEGRRLGSLPVLREPPVPP